MMVILEQRKLTALKRTAGYHR